MITWGPNPIAWRSSRQSTIALSTAEAELSAILEGAIALLGIESLLVDLAEEIEDKKVGSDSVSALTISAGNGSWRTRRLRLKSAWLQEMIALLVVPWRVTMFQDWCSQRVCSRRHWRDNVLASC